MMTSDHHHSLRGAGNQHSPAPSLPVYSICEICGEADERTAMTDGMCRDCIGVVREALRMDREKRQEPFHWHVALAMAVVAVAILWRWVR